MKTLTTDEVQEQANAGDAIIINVLDHDQYEQAHIPGSINIPVDTPNFSERVEEVAGGKDEPVILYCASKSCPASEKAAEVLDENGFSSVADYEVGMQGWQESGLPVAPLL